MGFKPVKVDGVTTQIMSIPVAEIRRLVTGNKPNTTKYKVSKSITKSKNRTSKAVPVMGTVT
jgi:hypothetical protein